MRHDPERLAARFLDGQMRRPERWRYERHMVECGECWTQVRQARAGRSAVESLRKVAPAHVRERVRAIPELGDDDPDVPRRLRPATPLLLAMAAIIVALVVSVVARGDGDRANASAMGQVAAAYRDGTAWAVSAAAPPTRVLAGLRWVETRVSTIEDDRVLGYRYTDGHGATVLVVRREGRFESPSDAEPIAGADWTVDVDGVTVVCTHPPEPVLVVGVESDLVARAARTLTEKGA